MGGAYRILTEFRKLNPEMQVNTMLVFLAVASSQEPVGQYDISQGLGLTQSVVSRIVADLSDVDRYRNELQSGRTRKGAGLGLVKRFENPRDRRLKLVEITPRGRMVADSLKG